MLSFMLQIKVREEFQNRALETLSSIEKQAHGHSGVVSFSWFQDIEKPLQFTLIEQWESQEFLDAHVQKIIGQWNDFVPCLDGTPVSTQLKKLMA